MAAGERIKGEDGIIELAGTDEIACLTSWSLESSANVNTLEGRCMKSNSDGGSAVAAPWDEQETTSKSWSVTAEMFWQEDATAGANLGILGPEFVGNSSTVKLYPNDSTSGQVEYSGSVIIESVGVPSEVSGRVTQSVTLRGDGALTKALVA